MLFWKKNTSLSGLLVRFFAILTGAVLFLLVCMDWYLIRNYQLAQRNERHDALEDAANSIRLDMERLRDMIYDYYENNHDFNALTIADSDLEEYSCMYELDAALQGRMMLEECLDGYFLYSGADFTARYRLDTEKVNAEHVDVLKNHTRTWAGADVVGRNWSYVQIGDTRYAYLMIRKQDASLGFVYNLTQREQALQLQMPSDSTLFFVQADGGFPVAQEHRPLIAALQAEDGGIYTSKLQGMAIDAREIGRTGLWVCMQVPANLFYYVSVPTLLAVIATRMLYRQMRMGLVRPLENLVETMNRVRDGDWEARIEADNQFVEINKVDLAMEAMLVEIKKQKMLAYEQTIEKQQTQMKFLQLQLKPHFYLNGLKTLNALALDGERAKMQDLIISLSEHLRYLLQAEREVVPLSAEVAYVKNYNELQKNMTGRPFVVQWDIPADLEDWQIPTLCIQTFVENSFKYAKLGNAQKQLVLRVSAMELETEDGRYLDLCIRDNGNGYPTEVLEVINERPDAASAMADVVGVGIRNLQRRCELRYKGNAEYNFYNDGGAVSEVILPWIEEE